MSANIFDHYPSKYLTAADLGGQRHTAVIENILPKEVMPDGKTKPALSLRGFDKRLVLNKTNATNLAGAFGHDYTRWPGKTVSVYEAETWFQGKATKGIRLSPVETATPPVAPAAATPADGMPWDN